MSCYTQVLFYIYTSWTFIGKKCNVKSLDTKWCWQRLCHKTIKCFIMLVTTKLISYAAKVKDKCLLEVFDNRSSKVINIHNYLLCKFARSFVTLLILESSAQNYCIKNNFFELRHKIVKFGNK